MDGDWEKINRGSDKVGGVEETGKGTGIDGRWGGEIGGGESRGGESRGGESRGGDRVGGEAGGSCFVVVSVVFCVFVLFLVVSVIE